MTAEGGRSRGIAAWIRRWRPGIRRRPGRRVKLRQPVEGLIRVPVLRPVLSQGSEIAVKRAILLRQEDNVINTLETGGEGCRKSRTVGNRARARSSRAIACAGAGCPGYAPSAKTKGRSRAGNRSGRQLHLRYAFECRR